MHRVLILGQFAHGFLPQAFALGIYQPRQRWFGLRHNVTAKAGNKACLHHRAILIDDAAIADDVVDFRGDAPLAQAGQRRRKQKKRNPALQIPFADLRQYRKRRVVQHHRAGRVIKLLVVPAGVKRSHDLVGVDAVLLARPVFYNLVDGGRRVAVVGGFLGLKFFHKILVAQLLRHTATPL